MSKVFSGENSLVVRTLAVGAVGMAALSGCTSKSGNEAASSSAPSPSTSSSASSAPSSAPKVETTCSTDAPDKWQRFPSNFDPARVAQRLGVTASEVVVAARMGEATCDQPLPISRIGTPDAPIVSVKEIGAPCVVIGTREDPRTVTSTPNILAICISNASSAPSTLPTT